jgi:release factor glutamine methyltransferase
MSAAYYIEDMKEGIHAVPADPADGVTIDRLLRQITETLAAGGIDDPGTNAELMIASVLNEERGKVIAGKDRNIDGRRLDILRAHVDRRLRREPLQYILGETGFMGLRFFVGPDVLIPRPETEVLVERALAIIGTSGGGLTHVLDIGTGSGNIAISLAKLAPGTTVTALDVSDAALGIARGNIRLHDAATVIPVQGDIHTYPFTAHSFDMIVANPPYISLSEFGTLQEEIRLYEPRLAATDEGDGFRIIRHILERAKDLLHKASPLLMEIGFEQAPTVSDLAHTGGWERVRFHSDLAGIPRVFEGWTPGGPA